MIKKALISAAVLMTAGSFVFGRDVMSYVKTWGSSVREAVKAEVPLEFQVQRAREMVESLVPEIRHSIHVIAEQQVELEHLSEGMETKQAKLDQQKKAIVVMRKDVEKNNGPIRYASHTYTPAQVQRDLKQRFERYKVAVDSLERDRQILTARKQMLAANEDKLDSMLADKEELQVKIAQLEARLKTVQAVQSTHALDVDDSQLARAKKLIRELNKQLDVQERIMDTEGKFVGLIPVDTEASDVPVEDVTQEIDAYFDSTGDQVPQSDEVADSSH